MLKDLLGWGFRKPSINEITASQSGLDLLRWHTDENTVAQILQFLQPLTHAYRSPDIALMRIAEGQVEVDRNQYFLPIQFSVADRRTGQCGDIARWLLYDLYSSGLAKKLQEEDVMLNYANGQSPLFYNALTDNHVFLNLAFPNNQRIVLDGSFGNIVNYDRESGYRIADEKKYTEVLDMNIFSYTNRRIYGWFHLKNGGKCPRLRTETSPHRKALGINMTQELSFGLGFESFSHIPFITVAYPHGDKQELYWHGSNQPGEICFMSSHGEGNLALHRFTSEIENLVSISKQITVAS